ncbi:hypothetical protein ASD12_18050 [Mesorhizobium sp. Root102]|uniref:hypothetical protein n=1 Tax=Mesorhizobium sp. Root102 TaxID=1736422 RepID=UPI0006F88B45|nr:hypothetical protein [Mesorhizobium sp. Root102]KQU77703.1 hypothetical protein ASD12_18050 [Mesorhizobium sp. Root102]
MPASPSTANYRIPAAFVEMKLPGDADYVDAGNLVDFVYTPTVTKKEHNTARVGLRAKDFTAVTVVAASIKATLDENTARNIAMFMLSTVDTNTAGDQIIDPLTSPNLTVDIRLTATNTIGPMIDFEGNVTLSPSGDFNLLADNDDFAQIPLIGDVNKADGRFGRFTVRQQAGVTA